MLFMWSKLFFLFLSSSTNSAITLSIINQITKLRTFLKSTLNGLLENVQPLLIGPSGAREIDDKKVFPIFVDTLYFQLMMGGIDTKSWYRPRPII